MNVAGMDGCRDGWIIVTAEQATVVPTFAQALIELENTLVIALDMPIGLLDRHDPGGRACDRAARALLGRTRAASVFSAPPRPALHARTLAEARALGARLTLQTLNILPKIAEVDAVMNPDLCQRVFETHPELAFMAMRAGIAIKEPKRTTEGRLIRRNLLLEHGLPIHERPRGAAVDDLLDATALLWSARRIAAGVSEGVLVSPEVDAHGLTMQISW